MPKGLVIDQNGEVIFTVYQAFDEIQALGGSLRIVGVFNYPTISPTISSDEDNYAPATGNSMRQVIRIEATGADRAVTGLAIQQTGDTYVVINVGATYNVTLEHQSASSTASNRIISPTGADLVLGPDEYANLWHDPTTDRWRILGTNGA